MPFASVCCSFVEMLQHVEASVLVGEGKLAMLSYAIAHFSQDGQVEYGLRAYIEGRSHTQSEEELLGDAVVPAGCYGNRHDELAEFVSSIACVSAVLLRKERHVFLLLILWNPMVRSRSKKCFCWGRKRKRYPIIPFPFRLWS